MRNMNLIKEVSIVLRIFTVTLEVHKEIISWVVTEATETFSPVCRADLDRRSFIVFISPMMPPAREPTPQRGAKIVK